MNASPHFKSPAPPFPSTKLTCLLIAMFFCLHAASRSTAGQEKGVGATDAQQSAELQEASDLDSRVKELYAEGKYKEAVPLAEHALALAEKALGTENQAVAVLLNRLAGLYLADADYARAEPLYLRLLTMEEKMLGPEHPNVGNVVNSLAELYERGGDYARAEPLFLRALAVAEKSLGTEQPGTATILNNLGAHYLRKGDYAKAEPLLLRALATREKVLGPEHPDVAQTLNNLAELYKYKGDYAKAEPVYKRALAIWEKTHGPEHPDVATLLSNFAELYRQKGDYAQAESLQERALAIREKALGPDYPDVAVSLNNLALLRIERGDYARAEPLLLRALAIMEKAFGPEHPDVAKVLDALAEMYHRKGDYGKAEPLFLRAISIEEKALGTEHPDVAHSVTNLAALYRDKGDYEKAAPLFLRALTISEKALGPEHPNLGAILNDIALIADDVGDYEKAELLYKRALSIAEKALGPEHPDVANALGNLAGVYMAEGEYAKAEPLFRRALGIADKVFGAGGPEVARHLNNLAELYRGNGEYAQAEPLYERAVEIDEKALGPDHPVLSNVVANLGLMYLARGDITRAVQFSERADEIRERNISLVLATGSERQKLAYLAASSGEADSAVSLHLRYAPSNPQALRLALSTVLRRKGRALDAMADQIGSMRRRLDPQDRALLDQLSLGQSQLSALMLAGPGKAAPEEYNATVARLEAEVERVQDEASRRSAEFRAQTLPVTVGQVQKALPAGAALVEFFSYKTFDAKAKTRSDRFGARCYVAYVLKDEGEPLWADLGEARPIDEGVTRLRAALKDPARSDVKEAARALDERVMRPVRKLLGDTRHVFISPDGSLNLVPFAALVDEGGKYLVESYSITYLTSGRDLLRLGLSLQSRQPPLVIADPLFGPLQEGGGDSRGVEGATTRRSADMSRIYFPRLPGTAEEAAAVGPLLPGATVLTQAQATEAALKRVSGPSILHIATHGFFLPDQPIKTGTADETRGMKLGAPSVAADGENPLLRSGIALEGANRRAGAEGEDGILTALEAAGLDLWGTKLVVLSACETGLGEVRNGEGVYGLRRALVLAGSESQVMSLWQVSDAATRDLMTEYYKRLHAGEGRTEALRQVQMEMLRGGRAAGGEQSRGLDSAGLDGRHDYSHPFFWAAFIQSGDWRPLRVKAASAR